MPRAIPQIYFLKKHIRQVDFWSASKLRAIYKLCNTWGEGEGIETGGLVIHALTYALA